MKFTVLVKAFRLLEILARSQGPRSLAELAKASQISKPTAHRILNDLSRLGYVERAGTGSYRITSKLASIAMPPDDGALVEATEPILAALQEKVGETVNLGVLRDRRVVYLSVLESSHALRRVTSPQASEPFHTTALGQAMVAHLDVGSQADHVRSRPLEARTPKTITDPDELERVLRAVRDRGYAWEQDQSELGVSCVAAPVFYAGGVAAISISAPSVRVTAENKKKMIAEARAAAAQATAALGPTSEPLDAASSRNRPAPDARVLV